MMDATFKDTIRDGEILEHAAKEMLRKHGIPVPYGELVETRDDAECFARSSKKSFAMKVMAHGIAHKTAAGYVELDVAPIRVGEVFDRLMQKAQRGASVEGILIEEMAPSGLEIVIGASTSEGFGPCVMFGAGGLDVEQKRDVTFRLAPLSAGDAKEMIYETSIGSACAMHRDFGADQIDAIARIILAVGGAQGIVLTEKISELDINPLRVSSQGIIALDAYAMKLNRPVAPRAIGLMTAAERAEEQKRIYVELRALFEPRDIVVVGASSRPGKMGFEVIKCLVDYGFKGRIFGVNPSVNNIYGCPVFPSLQDVPQTVDRAIIVVPAVEVPSALLACAKKGVRVAHVYSAGFSEWTIDGRSLEHAVKDVAESTGIRIVGPNSNGAFCASGRITKSPVRYSPDSPGKISFISQSGTYTSDLIARSKVIGLPLEKAVACGNCTDVGPVDYLLYCAEDPKTDIIAMYLETIRDAGAFFRLARQVSKPIILLKGGRTNEGDRVASTHTGALASDHTLWERAARQSGVVLVESIPELTDVLLGYCAFGTIDGPGLALFTSGGGISVTATDVATICGLQVPSLSSKSISQLQKFLSPGTSINNPVDVPVWGLRTKTGYIFDEMIKTLSMDPKVDSIIMTAEMGSIFNYARDETDGVLQMQGIIDSVMRLEPRQAKVSLVLRSTGDKIQDDLVREFRPQLLEMGIAVYADVVRAVRAHGKLLNLGQAKQN